VTSRIRVTRAGGCPREVASYDGVDNPDPTLATTMVPRGRPSAGLVCFYPPLSIAPEASGSPAPDAPRSVALSSPGAGRLAGALAAVKTGWLPGRATAVCPDDTGAVDIIVLTYRALPDTDIWYQASGCQSFSNGYLTAYEVANTGFYAAFLPAFAAVTATPAKPGAA